MLNYFTTSQHHPVPPAAPMRWPRSHACAELIGKRLTAEGGLADGGSGGVDPALMQALLALAVLEDDDE